MECYVNVNVIMMLRTSDLGFSICVHLGSTLISEDCLKPSEVFVTERILGFLISGSMGGLQFS